MPWVRRKAGHAKGRHGRHYPTKVTATTATVAGGVGGVLICLLASAVWPLTTHAFPDGAPFLLSTETSPTPGAFVAISSITYVNNFLLVLSPSCLAVL